ncbi:serine/arginine repetitive matrix protein 1-like [Boleophthalmus pectinirostris]|uniref:serine/arginine repetitive matrix protein 1-like n=1 Tax=Boleophthalmus pectinirostris TaxID=150288 RepID=UPI00242F597A|nr:serine/arginine repetitive matrix protein 1-like [Boleophthalmus pectinirostris]
MVGILAGGGGLVLVLIVATIVCCSINRKKRRMHIKDEQELRLQLSTENYQNHQCTNQRGHAHSHVAAPSQRPTPSPRPNTAAPHGPMSAGHTGPRPPRAGRNRPRPPDPITGQPLPGPRRLPETGQTQIPSVNDDENPPPLPQPRKKGHRT